MGNKLHESDRNRLTKEVRRLRFAAGDMRQAQAAIRALLATTEADDVNLMLALETAIAVCYVRPFTPRQGVGQLGDEWLPEKAAARSLHDQLVDLRDRAYAHTDVDSGREVVDRAELFDDGVEGFLESWLAMDRAVLPAVADMCRRQEDRFQAAARDRVAQLRQ
jgi:hypothetical protein